MGSWVLQQSDCLEFLRKQAENSVDFVFTSPPYNEKGERYDGNRKKWKIEDWVPWLTEVIKESCRVSRGYVMVVVNGRQHQFRYDWSPELLGISVAQNCPEIYSRRPIIWQSNKCPAVDRSYPRNAYEKILSFSTERKPYFDWQAIGTEKKYDNGGDFRQRNSRGERVEGGVYPVHKLAHPQDVQYVKVGGGHMAEWSSDEKFASQGEAPFPVTLAKHWISACCPPHGEVLDPFTGSGSTAVAALSSGRSFVGCELGSEQFELAASRIQSADEYLKKACNNSERVTS